MSTSQQHSRQSSRMAANLDQTLVSTLLDTKFQMESEGIVLECIPLLREMTRLRSLGLALKKDSTKDDYTPKITN